MAISVKQIIGDIVGGGASILKQKLTDEPEYKMLENVTVVGVRKVAKPSFLDNLLNTINKISSVKLPSMTQNVSPTPGLVWLVVAGIAAFLLFGKRR